MYESNKLKIKEIVRKKWSLLSFTTKRGHLGRELDNSVITYVKHLQSSGTVVNTAIVMAAGSRMVQYCI